MTHHDQPKRGRRRSVLDRKEDIAGLPSDKKSAVEEAAADKDAAKDCESVLDGPQCIEGVPEKEGRMDDDR